MNELSADDAAIEQDVTAETKSHSAEIVLYEPKRSSAVTRSKSTYNAFRESKRRLERGGLIYPTKFLPVVTGDEPKTYEEVLERGVRPQSYATCVNTGLGSEGKPCPFVSCKRHLALEIRGSSLVVCAPHTVPGKDDPDPVIDIDFDSMKETCSNRLFEEPHTLETIGESLGLTRERVRQIESNGMKALQRYLGDSDLSLLQSRIAESASPKATQLVGSIWRRKMDGSKHLHGDHSYLVRSVREDRVVDLVCISGMVRDLSLSKDNLTHKYELLYDGSTPIAAYAVQYWLVGA